MGLRAWLHGAGVRGFVAPSGSLGQGGSGKGSGFNTPSASGVTGLPAPDYAKPPLGKPLDQLKAGRAGRSTHPSSATLWGQMVWLPRHTIVRNLEALDLSSYTPEQIVDMLIDASPEASMAAWNVLRLANSGWGISVKDKNDTKDDATGLQMALEVLRGINRMAGGVDAVLNQLHLSAFSQGAVCIEAPPVAGLKSIEDIYPIQPWTIRFRWVPVSTQPQAPFQQKFSEQYEGPFQLTMQQWVPSWPEAVWLNPAQVFYIPLDPQIDDPYGRAPALAGVGAIQFWLEVLRDLRRALHMNAYGRLEIKVVQEMIAQNAPEQIQDDPEALRAWLSNMLADVQKEYAKLEPDDAVIHWDSVEAKAIDSSGKTLNMEALLHAIEQLVIRGLKQLPTLMGGGANTRGAAQLGTLEYQIYSTGIQAIQALSARAMELALELALRLAGRQARVHWNWNPIRTTDRLKEAQAQALEIQNSARMEQLGWIDHNEAALTNAGHEPAGPAPDFTLINNDRPSPPPMPTNQKNPMDGKSPNPKQPSVGETTKEPGDQGAAPKPAPSRERSQEAA